MKRACLLLPMLLCLLATVLPAQSKLPTVLTVTLEKSSWNLYETVRGTVDGLDTGEKFTVELVDVYGRVLTRETLKRQGYRGTPFALQIRGFSSTTMSVEAKGETGRTGNASFRVPPPTPGWGSFLLLSGDTRPGKTLETSNVLRLLGIHSGVATDPAGFDAWSRCNFRVLALDVAGDRGLQPTAVVPEVVPEAAPEVPPEVLPEAAPEVAPDAEAPPAGPAKKKESPAPKRVPCLSQTNLVHNTLAAVKTKMADLAPFNPLGYVLFSSPGVTSNNAAVDYCFDDKTLVEFRDWLKKQYTSAGVLGRQWNVKVTRWEEVVPMTAGEVLKREFGGRRRGEPLNFSPWADHRAFMDEKLGTVVKEVMEGMHASERGVRVGFRGGLAPAAYGGYDWTLLSQAADIMECSEPTYKRLAGSLNRQRFNPGYMLGTLSDLQPPGDFLRNLWSNVAAGDLGVFLDPGTSFLDDKGLPSELSYKARPSFLALEGLGHVLITKEFVPATKGVYVYYSQPSIRVQYMLDLGAQGAAFRPGMPSDGLHTSTWHRNMLAWTELLDDLGIEFEFLSYRRLNDRGWMRGVNVIVLPKTLALSEKEADELRRFVEQGGTVIADSQTGLFNEHGVQQEKGTLDGLFGIRREGIETGELAARYTDLIGHPLRLHKETGRFEGLLEGLPLEGLKPVEPKVEPMPAAAYHAATGRNHVLCTRTVGRGNAVYLNVSLIDYPWDRMEPGKASVVRETARRIFAVVGATPGATPVKVGERDVPNVALRQFKHRENGFIIVVRRGRPPEAPAPPPPPQENPPEPVPPQEPLPGVVPEEPQPLPPDAPPPLEFQQIAPEGEAPAAEEPPAEPEPPKAVETPAQGNEEAPKEEPLIATAPDYRVKAADSVTVEVAGQPDLTRVAVVGDDGKINLHLLGDVEVAGMTAAEIQEKLTGMYGELIVGVKVTVTVATPEGKKGEPEKPVLKGDFFKIQLEGERYVYDVLTGRLLGKTAEPLLFLPEDECTVLALLDYEVKGVNVDVTLRPQELTYRIRLDTTGRQVGLHAYRVQFLDPKGNVVGYYTTTLPAPAGYAGGGFTLALNDMPGTWTLRVTDVLTGTRGEAKFTVK